MIETDIKAPFQVTSLDKFITEFKLTLSELFAERNANGEAFTERSFSKAFYDKLMSQTPLSVAIPSAYGGRGAKPKECISLLEAASYESIPLTLIFGINIALFIEPFAKYGHEDIKQHVFDRFLKSQAMGGLMITEPAHGSDALNMKTTYTQKENGDYHLQGIKHWQGLTGMADYWLVAARSQKTNGALSRDVDLFVTEDYEPSQHIKVTQLYNNYGLYPIPYGVNEIDINLPHTHRLEPQTTGIKMLMDTLHRSRLQFPGMAIGFLKRALEEATRHCQERIIRGSNLLQFDQINKQLVEMETAFTLSSAMCFRSANYSSIDNDLAICGIEANTFKAIASNLMQESAQTLMQLLGGKGYTIQSLGARSIMDSRPFQIFEGPNEMLFTQLAEMMLKGMSRAKQMNLLAYMTTFELSSQSANLFKDTINITLEKAQPQRKLVLLGHAMAKVIMAHHVLTLSNSGFNQAMIDNCIVRLRNDVSTLMNSYSRQDETKPVEGFQEQSSWRSLC